MNVAHIWVVFLSSFFSDNLLLFLAHCLWHNKDIWENIVRNPNNYNTILFFKFYAETMT